MADYITKLQQENKRLKVINNEYERLNKEKNRGFKITNVQTYDINELLNYKQKYDKALELLVDFNLPCENDDFNTTAGLDYCSKYCCVDEEQYKKCWNEFIEWRLKDE